MKTLDQVEPRTPISSLPFTITAEGSYYLTGNLQPPAGTPSGDAGIRVQASNVTIDLNGFALIGNGILSHAINIPSEQVNVTIRNGTIRGWGLTAVQGNGTARMRAADLRITSNASSGLLAGAEAIVTDCVAEGNSGNGIAANFGSIIERCIATGNTGSGSDGIFAGANSIVRRCVARDNGGDGIQAVRSLITECEALSNDDDGIDLGQGSIARACHSVENVGSGINGGIRSQVRDCVTTENGSSGITVLGDSVVLENRASNNGRAFLNDPNPPTSGIDTSGGGGSRIEANQTRDNRGIGIKASANDIVSRNSSGGNSTVQFSPTSGANFGTRQTISDATNPHANREF